MKIISQLLVALLIFLHSTDIIKANQVIYQQDFSNSTEIENWDTIYNYGNNRWGVCLDTAQPANWQIKDEWMGIILDGTSCTTIISPAKQVILSQYSSYTFEVDVRFDESVDMDRNILFAWSDENNWYDLKFYGSGVHLEKFVNGTMHALKNSQNTFPFVKNQIYHIKIFYSAQTRTIQVSINEQTVIETADLAPYITTPITFGLKTALGGGRSVAFFDNLLITTNDLSNGTSTEDETKKSISVPLVKQTNLQWAETEYDHATEWSENKTTIKRWGCALTSMVMILKYYGIDVLPNGQVINPLSLNNWLNNQPDGYIGNGLFNWLAITRLTKQISDILGTPKLEFSRQIGESLEPTIDQINLLQPTILNIIGHFLVGNGYYKNKQDLIISDPAYSYQNLNEHQSELLSTLIFTPSHTDLSYIQIVTDENTELTIENSQGKLLPTSSYFESLGSYDELNEEEKEVNQQKVYLLAKPNSDSYRLTFTHTAQSPIHFSLYTYDQSGNVSIVHHQSTLVSNQERYQFDYHKEENNSSQNIEIKKIVSWEAISQEVTSLSEEYIINYTNKIVNWAKQETTDNQKRYANLLINFFEKISLEQLVKKELITDLLSLRDSI